MVGAVHDAYAGALRAGSDAAVEAAIDVDSYLSWLAFNVVLRNGDFADEAIFYCDAEARAPDGGEDAARCAPGSRLRIAGAWDLDRALMPCHLDGRFGVQDPLFHCAESTLDHRVALSPTMRKRYRASLRYPVHLDAVSLDEEHARF